MLIQEKLHIIKNELPKEVTLVAVSKTKPTALITALYDSGQRIFGENKVQELSSKHELLPKDIQWHMIRHLQRNKVKYIAPFVSLIHAVDTIKLLKEIDKQALLNNRKINCLLQVKIAQEDSKYGLDNDMLNQILKEKDNFNNVVIAGLMGMATFTADKTQIAAEFAQLKITFDKLKTTVFKEQKTFNTLSMGMSGDYKIAISAGSTMVRVGSAIFGARNY